MRNWRTYIVNVSYNIRIVIDKIIYWIVKPFNRWELLDVYKDKDILIVGNGPSLNQTDLEKIRMVSIGMNKINLLFDKTDWRPTIITCVNGLVLYQNRKFFNTTKIILILPPKALYVGIRKRKNVLIVNSHESIEFKDDINNSMSILGATVTYTALQTAAFLHAKSVNIVGVDHFFRNYSGKSSIEKYEGDDTDHFDSNYFKNSYWGLPDLEGSELAYTHARNYFDSKNIPITDYTINGKCQVFNKGDIEDIYK